LIETKQFSTSLEASSLDHFAMNIQGFVGHCINQQYPREQFSKAEDKPHPQKQTAGRAVPPLIPEYERVTSVFLPSEPTMDGKHRLQRDLPNIPTDSKLLRSEAKRGSGAKQFTMYVLAISWTQRFATERGETIYNVCFWQFHGHKGFATLARAVWHPFDELKHLPDLMVQAILTC
jgi:hypothetical protein